jgi:hypothetical protein
VLKSKWSQQALPISQPAVATSTVSIPIFVEEDFGIPSDKENPTPPVVESVKPVAEVEKKIETKPATAGLKPKFGASTKGSFSFHFSKDFSKFHILSMIETAQPAFPKKITLQMTKTKGSSFDRFLLIFFF